jgi:ubiquinone/menaquinone biosynthesis C-methylase UbiE
MGVFTTGRGYEVSHVLSDFDWEGLGNSTVVDIGGSRGYVAIALASRFESLNVIVQDFDNVIQNAEKEVPHAVTQRVSFQAHDIFDDQAVVADVYYYRWVFHNWSDKYCIKILRSLIPVLRPGANVVINDICVPEPGSMALWRERELRYVRSSKQLCLTRLINYAQNI